MASDDDEVRFIIDQHA